MLRYLNRGLRDNTHLWGPQSLPAEIRGNWEFMAVIKGSAKPLCEEETEFPFAPKRLWIMPPMSKHTWRTRENEACEIITMHFASLPAVVEHFLGKSRGPFSIELTSREIATIAGIYDEVLPHYEKPHLGCVVWFEKALTDLCILVVHKLRTATSLSTLDGSTEKVQQALEWYRAHLSRSPSLEELCAAIEVSLPQLRKMFKTTLNDTPSQAFLWLALNEACMLMALNSLSLKEIAAHCGFANAAHFSRVFKRQFRVAPSEWSNNLFYGKLGFKPNQL